MNVILALVGVVLGWVLAEVTAFSIDDVKAELQPL